MTIPLEVSNFLETSYRPQMKVFKTTANINHDLRDLRKEAQYLMEINLPLEYIPFGIKIGTSMYNFIVEPLKNARAHSDSPEPFNINFGYYANQNKIVLSCSDGGTYFRNPEIKKTWENKTNRDKHITNIHGIGGGMGRELLFIHGDFIYIDTKTATLYTGLKTSNEVFFIR